MSDAVALPSRPDPAAYRKLAKELLRACGSGDPRALRAWATRWIESVASRWAVTRDGPHGAATDPELRDRIRAEAERLEQQARAAGIVQLAGAQWFLARAHGFESWPRFIGHVDALRAGHSPDANFEAAADAIVDGDAVTLRRLLQENPGLVRQRSGRTHRSTLLHYVSANGVEDFRQRTPANIVAVARLLLDAGGDVNAESDAYGGHATTLALTATSVHPETAGVQSELLDLLLERGASLDPTIVNACLANGRGAAAEHLARRGAALDLEGAAGVGRRDLVERLLPEAAPERRAAAFLYACQFGRTDIARLLLERGVAPTSADGQGMTGLHWAAHGGPLDVIRLLLGRGAPLEARNVYGGTVLGQAVWSAIHHRRPDHLRIIETLVAAGAQTGPDWFTGRADIDAALGRTAVAATPADARITELRKQAHAADHAGDGDRARALYEEAVALCRATGNPLLLAHTLRHLADLDRQAGAPARAEGRYLEALALYRGHGATALDLANALRGLALVREEAGAFDAAEHLWGEAQELYLAANVPPGAAESAARLAALRKRRTR